MAEAGRRGIKGLRLEKYFWILILWGTRIGVGICMVAVANVKKVEG